MSTNTAQTFELPDPSTIVEEPVRRRRHAVAIRVAALNITAMMDLVLNLLLFFVLTANFSISEGSLPADLPAGTGGGAGAALAVNQPKPPENPLVISLRSFGGNNVAITVEGTGTSPASFEDLFEKLKGWQNNDQNVSGIYKADNPIVIRPDRDVLWNHVVDCFNSVVRARYTNVGFAPSN
jgi:biopolymer transport protein ExbD